MPTPDERPTICLTCGTQYPGDTSPERCLICDEPRQYVAWGGQQWISRAALAATRTNSITEEERGLYSLLTTPAFAINQRAFIVRTREGNLLWDCLAHLDDDTVGRVRSLGGVRGIAISHPHYYTTMVEWSHAFGQVPIFLHALDRPWVVRPDPLVHFWDGDTLPLWDGMRLVRTGGHFDGFQVLLWPRGANGAGVLLAGDQPQVAMDRRFVAFLYSYPNMVPLGATAVRAVDDALRPLAFNRLYGAFEGRTIGTDAKNVIARSVARHLDFIAR